MGRRRASRIAAAWAIGALALSAAAAPAAAETEEDPESGAPSCDIEFPQLVPEEPAALAGLGFDRAWSITRGAGVEVAVVGTGIAQANDHFPGDAVAAGTNVVRERDPATVDVDGRGTAIAGIVGARGIEGSGVVGAAPEVTLVPVRVGYGGDSGGREDVEVTPGRLAEGIRAAADSGAQVIAVGMATTRDTAALRSAVADATAGGALVVASVGGAQDAERQAESDEESGAAPAAPGAPWYPAAYPEVLAVAAVTEAGAAVGARGPWVDVAAPGQTVPTAFRDALDCVLGADPEPTYATGYAAAAAALVAAAFPEASPAEWAYRLEATASGAVTDSRDDATGWGVVNPFEALTLYVDGSAPGPTPPASIEDRQEAPEVPAAEVDLSRPIDPDAAARERLVWWLLGGLTALGLLLLIPRLPRRTKD